ncbi:MAG TPA: Tm-1-like ATP-binding domain-containing protein [Cellulomonas sp.]
MRSAAILGSWDTKRDEMRYMRTRLADAGVLGRLIDVSTVSTDQLGEVDGYGARDILRGREERWAGLAGAGRGAKIDFMAEAVRDFVLGLYLSGEIEGVISAGGLQNMTLATAAMKALPVGFPKVMATTVATGRRPFVSVVGESDIVVIPALADLAGLNFVTRSTLDKACECLAGMMTGRSQLQRPAGQVVGLTLMGVTSESATGAIEEFVRLGLEPVGFHATGTGGIVLEEFVAAGLIDGVLELNLHEVVSEHFGGGYSYGALGRLRASVERGVPLVVTPGGLDFVDYWVEDFAPGLADRRYVLHNGTLAHIKLTLDEATEVGALVGSRLAAATRPVPLLVPTLGLRAEGRPGEAMSDPEVDQALVAALVGSAAGAVQVEEVPLHLNTREFGRLAAARYVAAAQHPAASPALPPTLPPSATPAPVAGEGDR